MKPRLILAFGEQKTYAEWIQDPRCKVSLTTLQSRIELGELPENALTLPKGGKFFTKIRDNFIQYLTNTKPELAVELSTLSWEECREYAEQEVCALYNKGLNPPKIEKIVNLSQSFVKTTIYKYGVNRATHPSQWTRKYFLNENYFDKIDTEEKAYFLGLLWADGCNHRSDNISITLQKEDGYILEMFSTLLGGNIPVKICGKEKQYRRIDIFSKYMSAVLNDYGLVPRKSLIVEFPECVPNLLINHFCRGAFDGDGTICLGKKVECNIVSGSFNFIEEYQKIILENTGLVMCVSKRMNGKNLLFRCVTSRRRSLVFLEFLYRNSTIHLNRKRDKYLKLIELYKDQSISKLKKSKANP